MLIENIMIHANFSQPAGPLNCYATVAGETRKLGSLISGVKVVLYDQNGVYQRTVRSDENGLYYFIGCARNMKYNIVAFDPDREFNAAIQANVVAK